MGGKTKIAFKKPPIFCPPKPLVPQQKKIQKFPFKILLFFVHLLRVAKRYTLPWNVEISWFFGPWKGVFHNFCEKLNV